MANFWTAEDKIPIGQTKIAVPAEHGLDYDPGQKIEFHIPASVNFFQPKESYLKFDVQLSNSGDPLFLQLDGQLGGQVLIRDLRVYSGGSGRVLLEEYQNYNVLTALKYDYEINDTIKQKRALTEGCVYYDGSTRSTMGIAQDTANNIKTNPYFTAPGTTRDATSAEPDLRKAKCLLPLNTGIFQNDKIFPVGLTEGLIVEIILEEKKNCVRALDTVMRKRKLMANPVFLSSNSTSDTAAVADPNNNPQYPLGTSVANGSAFTEFFVRRDNMMGINASVGGSQFPFCIGQKIQFCKFSTNTLNPSVFGDASGVISNISYVAGSVNATKITLATPYSPTAALSEDFVVVDMSLADASAATWAPSYKITDCEFIVQQVTMPGGYTSKLASMMKEGGAMNYDFLSFTNYKTSQIASEKLTTLRVPLVQSRAKSVLAIPTDASVYTQKQIMDGDTTEIENFERDDFDKTTKKNANHSVRPGLVGITDNLTQYQLFYDGRLNPSRKVKCSKISDKGSVDQQPLIELEKALVMAGIKPHSMLNFQKNFCIGRALSLQDGVYDTRGKDFQLQVEYQETAPPEKNKLWNVWCAHLRRIVISGNAIGLQV